MDGALAAVPSGDLVAKYQKLAAEYSKLRVHVRVLKKGVVEEQERGAELRERLREKETSGRKWELEADSLAFRNAQLARRIAVLQDELDAHQSQNKSRSRRAGGGGGVGATPDAELLQEELQKKIVENAQYSSQLSERTFEVAQLRASLADYDKLLTESEAKYKCEIAKLQHHNHEALHQLEQLSAERGALAPPPLHPPAGGAVELSSEADSIGGSEDALSSAEDLLPHEQLYLRTQQLQQENERLRMECELAGAGAGSRRSRDSGDGGWCGEDAVTSDAAGRLIGLLGAAEVPFELSEEVRAREHTLQKYFRNKITALASEKQALESKTEHFVRECETLRTRREAAEAAQLAADAALQHKHHTIALLEEELQSTSHNYEQQMSMLTEHVADLTDRLSAQHDELQRLRARRK